MGGRVQEEGARKKGPDEEELYEFDGGFGKARRRFRSEEKQKQSTEMGSKILD